MKTLHLYLTRQVLATLLMTVAVFTFVLLLGNGLKEILVLLINRQATLGGVAEAFGLLIPFVLVFALPMGMLTAALLVFGRFSADQELTAVRSSGVSLLALISPILLLSLLLCGVSAAINMDIAPRCRVAYKDLLRRMGAKLATAALPEGRFVKDFKNYIFYIGRNDGRNLSDVHLWELDPEGKVKTYIYAPKGMLGSSNEGTMITLFDGREARRSDEGWSVGGAGNFSRVLELNSASVAKQGANISDMTFIQLQAELTQLENTLGAPDPKHLTREQLHKRLEQLAQLKQDMTMPVRVQMHRQIAFSFACFGFTLVGIPLGIQAHRRETNVGIAMALGLVLVYYSFIILGQSLQTHSQWAPHLIVWVPNFIFQAAGAVMLWRANRGI
jgi:lipopolysaccharide export system permease protein